MPHRIVIALGGNALQTSNKDDSEIQKRVASRTAQQLVKLISEGHEVILTHGNGPQVGAILLNEETGAGGAPSQLDTCSAMSQGQIGYWLQQALHNELKKQGIPRPVATVVTQTLVDFRDPAFKNPTKPIGPFYPNEKTALQAAKTQGFTVKEDAGRGWRRVVPSPRPIGIIEEKFITQALLQGNVVIAGGGGGVPVIERRGQLIGMEAVIDKDFAAEKLAEIINADVLIIATTVNKVSLNYQQPNMQHLSHITVEDAQQYINDGQFGAGSMLPKMQAAVMFANKKVNNTAIITSPQKIYEALGERDGTVIRRF